MPWSKTKSCFWSMTPSSAVHSFVRQPSSCIRAEPKKSTSDRRVLRCSTDVNSWTSPVPNPSWIWSPEEWSWNAKEKMQRNIWKNMQIRTANVIRQCSMKSAASRISPACVITDSMTWSSQSGSNRVISAPTASTGRSKGILQCRTEKVRACDTHRFRHNALTFFCPAYKNHYFHYNSSHHTHQILYFSMIILLLLKILCFVLLCLPKSKQFDKHR